MTQTTELSVCNRVDKPLWNVDVCVFSPLKIYRKGHHAMFRCGIVFVPYHQTDSLDGSLDVESTVFEHPSVCHKAEECAC